MSGVGTAAAAMLAVMFAWAAVAKFTRRKATVEAFVGIGLPVPRVLARAVPLAEMAVAVLLLVRPAAGGVAALVLLTAFTGLLVLRLRQGVAVRCGCFGDPVAGDVSAATLARNGLLAGLGVAALAAPVPSLPTLPALVAVSAAVACAAVVVALVDLRVRAGRVWDNRLETGPEVVS